jgi:hypothetical protein
LVAVLAACATTTFVSTWRAPDAQPLKGEGARVAVVVMSKNESMRLNAEESAARAITQRGGHAFPADSFLKNEPNVDEGSAKEAFEKAGVTAVVTLRPTNVRTEVSTVPTAAPPTYWGGYYGFGWNSPWAYSGTEVRTDTLVYVETRVYSMRQNKLVWTGESKTVNPGNVDSLMKDVIDAVAQELSKAGLL